jgi:hypothetical protein
MARNQQMAQQNVQAQSQAQIQSTQAASQAKQQELQLQSQLDAQQMQLKSQLEAQLETMRHEHRKEIELLKAQATLGFKTDDQEFREKLEVFKEDRKDDRVKKQTSDQSKLISQRQGSRGEIEGPQEQQEGPRTADQVIQQAIQSQDGQQGE